MMEIPGRTSIFFNYSERISRLKNSSIEYMPKLILLFLITAMVVFFTGCKDHSEKYLNLEDSIHYVGINTCKQCHMDIYRTFIQTGMGQSFGLASRTKSKAVFEES